MRERIDSVLNQTYPNFEIILLDDASTDDSLLILKEYVDHPRIASYKFNSVNSGSVFKQWENGIKMAKGDFIWIAESDDIADHTFLEKLTDPFLKNDSIGLSYSQSNIIDENSAFIKTNNEWTDDLDLNKWKTNYVENGYNECTKYLIYKNTIPNASAVIFKKELFKMPPDDFKLAGDWYCWISILLKSDISYISEPLNNFRKHENTTRQKSRDSFVNQRIYEEFKIIKLLQPHIENSLYHSRMRQLWFKYEKVSRSKSLFFDICWPTDLAKNVPLFLRLKSFWRKLESESFNGGKVNTSEK